MSNLHAVIPEKYTRFIQLPNSEGHNAVWDFVQAPNGRFYISVCGENEKPLTALLYEYYPETGELRLMFDVARIWMVDDEQMPPSKIHTSIDFLPDGKLIMATHNTAPAPNHKQWMYEQHYEHPWEGYPGSILMVVDPDTNEVQVKGIPVPRESIYGGMLGYNPRYYYFLGYMRGHFYRIDLETNEVKDYGKVSEFSSCRLIKDDKGRLYGSSYTGGVWRYDPESDEIEDLKIQFNSPNGTKFRRQFIFALHTPRGTLLMADNVDSEIIELHPDTLEVTRHGHIHVPGGAPTNPYGIGGLAADENFVVYYGLKTYDDYFPIRLMRWDILNGGKPENLGLIRPDGKDSQYICEMIFDQRGLLHMVDVCGEHSPYILTVDTKKLQPPGEDAPRAELTPYTEPNWNLVGRAAFMHIVADQTAVLPLHQHMDWKHTVVRHVRMMNERVYSISGKDAIYVVEADYTGHAPQRIQRVYEGGSPAACLDLDDQAVAALTSDGRIVRIDLISGSCAEAVAIPSELQLTGLHCLLGGDGLLANDREGAIYLCSLENGSIRKLDDIQMAFAHAHIIKLDDDRLLLSGKDDELLIYSITSEKSDKLMVRTPSIRGRAFKATLTGGAVLKDGVIVAGTQDGLLFTLSSDCLSTTAYGRLYSSGELRRFIKLSGNEIAGIYGGQRDAGHLFYYSSSSGFVDLGRPRVVKDNNELSELDTEWADIHYISSLAYSEADDWLCAASGEKQYGAIVRYRNIRSS